MKDWIYNFRNKFRNAVESDEVKERAKIAEDILFGVGSLEVDKHIVDATAKLTDAFCRN